LYVVFFISAANVFPVVVVNRLTTAVDHHTVPFFLFNVIF
jgi:hypothetical protein